MLWVVKLPVFCSIYMLCMKPGCVSSSLFGILQLWEGDIGDELFRGTAFQERKKEDKRFFCLWIGVLSGFGFIVFDSVVYLI